MENKNTTNTSKENNKNKKTLLYVLGIVAIVLLVGGGWFYLRSGKKATQEDDTALISQAKKLIDHDFLGEKCYNSIAAYNGAISEEKADLQRKLEQELPSSKSHEQVEEAYKQKQKEMENTQNDIEKQVADYLMEALFNDLDDLSKLANNYQRVQMPHEKNNDKNSSKNNEYTQKAKEHIEKALNKLKEANDAVNYSIRKTALQEAKVLLNKCITKEVEWPSWVCIPSSTNSADYNLVKAKIEKIDAILKLIQKAEGDIKGYSGTSLKKALATWENDYQQTWQEYKVRTKVGALNSQITNTATEDDDDDDDDNW